jgi:predicted DNA-binding transcriptional regulator AlpA
MQVLSLDQAAFKAGIVRRTLERMLAEGTGPAKVQVSKRRVGILEDDLEHWLNSRRRPASSEAPASALPLLNQFVDGKVRPGSRALRARPEMKKRARHCIGD